MKRIDRPTVRAIDQSKPTTKPTQRTPTRKPPRKTKTNINMTNSNEKENKIASMHAVMPSRLLAARH
jgi:hypothetical protein